MMTAEPENEHFKIKVHFDLQHELWCREQGMSVKFFQIFDGGGYNFDIAEFQTARDAAAFMEHFGIEPSEQPVLLAGDGGVILRNKVEVEHTED